MLRAESNLMWTGQAIANASNPRKPSLVIPFAMREYDGPDSARGDLVASDAVAELLLPYDLGAQGLIVWGTAGTPGKGNYSSLFWNSTVRRDGPMIRRFLDKVNACSTAHCGGPARGRCMPSNGTRCQCYSGGGRPGCGA